MRLCSFFFKKLTILVMLFVTIAASSLSVAEIPTPSGDSGMIESPEIHENKATQPSFERLTALSDPKNYISDTFKIPFELMDQVGFWFDIYTLYGSHEHIIHHVLYPWIKFDVVDSRPIFDLPINKWVKYHKEENQVKARLFAVRKALKKLSQKKNYSGLHGLELSLFNSLQGVKGKRKNVFRIAAQNVRVQLGQKDFFVTGLNSSLKYLPAIEQEFIARGLPPELSRLPFVESSFNVKAESKVGASGIWQIMPSTGKHYMIVNDSIDERNSPFKASLVAIQIFKSNYKQLKSWPLAITAYNHGASGVKHALRTSRSDDLPELIANYHEGSFKFASANFYTSFLAAVYAEYYHTEIFSTDLSPLAEPLNARIVKLERAMKYRKLLKEVGIQSDELLEYNLDLKNASKLNVKLPRGLKIFIPENSNRNLEKRNFSDSNIFIQESKTNSSS